MRTALYLSALNLAIVAAGFWALFTDRMGLCVPLCVLAVITYALYLANAVRVTRRYRAARRAQGGEAR